MENRPDPFDLVRAFYRAMNRSDADAVAAFYHPSCTVEHVFLDDESVYQGRGEVGRRWADELACHAGALAGGHRIEVQRVAGMETGWGWVRADWVSAVRPSGDEDEKVAAGYSHFWIEDGLIRRHRTVRRDVAEAAAPAAERHPSANRHYPSRPIVGVGAVVLCDDDRVLLVKRKHEPLAGQWSLPGGTLEIGETLEAGTAREVLEETGLIVDVGPVIDVFDRILVDEDGKVRYHFVLIDSLCRRRGGTLVARTDVTEVALAPANALAHYRVTDKAQDVIRRAVRMQEQHPW